ncbi:hypothetical protein [Adlercreutzia equolifaciens]|uniref:hypothetical protein n=1 Tax=Adlercreutzia equolifaciens TaxID=446660 RepID=UPI003AF4FAAE
MNKKKCLFAVLLGIVVVAGLVGCAQQALFSASDMAGWNGITATQASPKDKVKFKLTEESECDACHALEVASSQNENCLAGNPEHEDVTCLDCHVKDKALEGAHRRLSADSKEVDSLKRTSVDDQTCLTSDCHTSEDVAANISPDALLVDANGTAVNPHEIHEIGQSHGDIKCADCHLTHKEGETLQLASDKCISCHHENVYECGTCH